MSRIAFTTSEDIGPAVRGLRTAKGWSHEHLAHEAGVCRSLISLVECGHRLPHTPKLIALLDALGYDLVAVKR